MGARGQAKMTVRMSGLGQDAGVVPAVGEHERELRVGQQVQLEDRPPGGDMVLLR
jgi:hypothetical protein